MLQPVSAHDVVPRHRLIDIAPVLEPVVPPPGALLGRLDRPDRIVAQALGAQALIIGQTIDTFQSELVKNVRFCCPSRPGWYKE
jgi:hypothetical protein